MKIITLVATAFFLGGLCSQGIAEEITAKPVKLSVAEKQMVAWIADRQDDILADLKTHVEINTGTENIKGIDRYRELMAAELISLGFSTKEYATEPMSVLSCNGGEIAFANHLVATRSGSMLSRIMLNGHMDTVFPQKDEFQTLSIDADGTLRGPGVADMKGGMVVMLYALKALEANGSLKNANITILLNSDEEIGSLGSRPLIEELARNHNVGLIFESSINDLQTRARKGLGQARLRITGRESHAGNAHNEGVSANLELAHKIIEIEKLTDYERKVTVNVGVMRGGEKRNTVPGCADAYIDLRYPNVADGEFLQSSIKRITENTSIGDVRYPGIPKTEVWTTLHRPPKKHNDKVDDMIAETMGLSLLLGEPIKGTRYSGGGTDGSITQAVGLPTLDSLGVDGTGVHSSRERTSIVSLMARTKLAAVMISRLLDHKP